MKYFKVIVGWSFAQCCSKTRCPQVCWHETKLKLKVTSSWANCNKLLGYCVGKSNVAPGDLKPKFLVCFWNSCSLLSVWDGSWGTECAFGKSHTVLQRKTLLKEDEIFLFCINRRTVIQNMVFLIALALFSLPPPPVKCILEGYSVCVLLTCFCL